MVQVGDVPEVEADRSLDAGQKGREVGLQTIERDGDRSVLIGGDHGTTSGETAPSGAVVLRNTTAPAPCGGPNGEVYSATHHVPRERA